MSEKRVVLDCRAKPEAKCSLTIAGTEAEVLELGLRGQLKNLSPGVYPAVILR